MSDLHVTLDDVLRGMSSGPRPVEPYRGRSALELVELFRRQAQQSQSLVRDPEVQVNLWIEEIDRQLSAQLDEILHAPAFQRLESAWRGLWFLVDRTETSSDLKIRVLSCTKEELRGDLCRDQQFDESKLFAKVYTEEYGTFGGEPYAALIGDFEFSQDAQDVELLTHIAEVAACAHAPFLSGASPRMFLVKAYEELSFRRDYAKYFMTIDSKHWNRFRESEDSRYVGLCVPHILLRLPYGSETCRTAGFNYEECISAKDHSQYLWGNAALALASCLTRAHATYGWPAAICGVEGGGLIEGLPLHKRKLESGEVETQCPTEIDLMGRREKEFSDLGFIPLVYAGARDLAAYCAVSSCHKVKRYNQEESNRNAMLMNELRFLLCFSKIAHYLKAISRDKFGSFMDRRARHEWLNTWIQTFKHPNPEYADENVRAAMPISSAFIEVEEHTGRPGHFRASAYLSVHYQLPPMGVDARFVITLP